MLSAARQSPLQSQNFQRPQHSPHFSAMWRFSHEVSCDPMDYTLESSLSLPTYFILVFITPIMVVQRPENLIKSLSWKPFGDEMLIGGKSCSQRKGEGWVLLTSPLSIRAYCQRTSWQSGLQGDYNDLEVGTTSLLCPLSKGAMCACCFSRTICVVLKGSFPTSSPR